MNTEKRKKWDFYEKRWRLRDFYFHKVIRRHICEKYLNFDPVMHIYGNQVILGKEKTQRYIAKKIQEGKPFMAGRFGYTELSVIASILEQRITGGTLKGREKFDEWFPHLTQGAGFFPNDPSLAEDFVDLMLDACGDTDVLAMWHIPMEDFVITEYMPQVRLSYLGYLEPWRSKNPWTAALEGKKVLVIHPFEESIRRQYERRELLFPGTKVLPEFELKTLKAVQTIAGEKDNRFNTWFEALDYMEKEALKIDFDVAVVGCGAYGFPLAAKLKTGGKQAVHFGGATQILFGIKGRRWVDNPRSGVPFNDAWVYPRESETPRNNKIVENGCYW